MPRADATAVPELYSGLVVKHGEDKVFSFSD